MYSFHLMLYVSGYIGSEYGGQYSIVATGLAGIAASLVILPVLVHKLKAKHTVQIAINSGSITGKLSL